MKKIKVIFLNVYGAILPLICAILGAIGGSVDGDKAYRRVLIPILITGFAFGYTESILTLTILFMITIFSIGYGIPDSTDKGAALARFWASIIGHDRFSAYDVDVNSIWLNVLTRGTIGLLIALSLFSIPIIKHNWLNYFVCGMGIMIAEAFFSWQDYGTYTLLNKNLSWAESITYGLITLYAVALIKY
jgi:hypothetical protein